MITKEMLKTRVLSIRAALKKEAVTLSTGEVVFVREMTAGEKDAFEFSVLNKEQKGTDISFAPDLATLRVKLIRRTLCDEEGTLLFSDDDIPWIANAFSREEFDQISKVALTLNGFEVEQVKKP